MKVAVIERKSFGCTCVNTGCIPAKTMVASGQAAHMVRRAADFGVVQNGQVGVDMKRVRSRKDVISAQSRTGVENWLRGMTNCTVYQGHGGFEPSKEVSVGSERLRADRIFFNLGDRALLPEIPGTESVPYLTNSSILDVGFLPRHLVVVGAATSAYRPFGTAAEFTVVPLDHVAPLSEGVSPEQGPALGYPVSLRTCRPCRWRRGWARGIGTRSGRGRWDVRCTARALCVGARDRNRTIVC